MQTPVLGWQLDPVLIGSLLALAVGYGLAVGPLRQRIAPGAPFPARKALIFSTAIILTYLAEGSPLHDLSERYLLSAHMVQHLLISYFCAPLLIWGTPDWLWRPLLLHPRVYPVARILTRPVAAAGVFALFLSLWHVPAIYDAGLRNSSLHHSQHILFMAISFLNWWPIMSPLRELPRLSYGAQLIYLFVTSTILQLPLFAVITFANEAFYPTYLAAPRITALSPMADQQLAGVIMKVLAMVIYAVPIIIIFYRWYNASERRPPRPASPESRPEPV